MDQYEALATLLPVTLVIRRLLLHEPVGGCGSPALGDSADRRERSARLSSADAREVIGRRRIALIRFERSPHRLDIAADASDNSLETRIATERIEHRIRH
jgi:hypothetical protein